MISAKRYQLAEGKPLKCIYTNADQLPNKRDDLLCMIADGMPDLIFVTECIPKAQVLPIDHALLDLPKYNLHANFDAGEHGLGAKGARGICIYVSDAIQAREISFTKSSSIEHIWIRINLQGTDQLLAGCVYRSPSSDPTQSTGELAVLFQSAVTSGASHLLISGDFNIPHIDWQESFCTAPSSHFAHKFLTLVQDSMLFQHVTQPTRYREGDTPRSLDLLFTNEEGMLSDLCYLPGIGKSDHLVLRFDMRCYTYRTSDNPERLNFNKANFALMNEMINNVDWQCLSHLDVEEGYTFFRDSLSKVVSACVPFARNSKSRKNIYMNSHALRLKKKKNQLWWNYTHTHDPLDLARYKACRNSLRRLTRELRRSFEAQPSLSRT